MSNVSNAEKAVLMKMYPEGCRVELEYMGLDSYGNLECGDLGTVISIDDAGQVHISWDKGSSLALAYKVDRCKCLMTKEQMQESLLELNGMSFTGIVQMMEWIEDKFLPVFLNMLMRPPVNNELIVELGNGAFKLKMPQILVGFTQNAKGEVYVKECSMREGKVIGRAYRNRGGVFNG